MTNINFGRTDMISDFFPTINLGIVSALLFILWYLCHYVSDKSDNKYAKSFYFVMQLIISSATIWSMLQIFGRHVLLATSWSLWSHAALGGTVIELMILLYRHEYSMTSRAKAYLMVTLRTLTIVIITFILTQPILREQHRKGIERTIAVLIDDSASMYFSDNQLTISEKLDIAKLYKLPGLNKRPDMDKVQESLENLIVELENATDDLELPLNLDNNYIETKLAEQREDLLQLITISSKSVRTIIETFAQIQKDVTHYGGPIRVMAGRASLTLKNSVLTPILSSTTLIKGRAEVSKRYRKLQENIEDAKFAASEFTGQLPVIKNSLDNAFYMQLNHAVRAEIDKTAHITRAELARKIILSQDSNGENFLTEARKTHGLTLVRFTDKQESISEEQLMTESESKANENQKTDLTAALEYVSKQIPSENLAGIIVLSDGCHNTASSPDPIAKQLARQSVPVCTIRMGGTKVPRDNAIMNVIYPTSIFLGEQLLVGVELASNGYKDRSVEIELIKNKKVMVSKKVYLNTERFKTTVQLKTKPEKNGVFSYQVRVKELKGEASTKNNLWDISVAVSDDRTNVLLIDNHPRWEFRYLRNLFHGRDKSVHLQHLLITPDSVDGVKPAAPVPASAEREFGDDHATAFPSDKKEWSKFDVIILGDLSPDVLTDDVIQTIKYCVEERGALLACIAGQLYMPHAFTSEKLKELLPINYSNAKPERVAPYKLGLTPFGRHHMIMQQAESLSENMQIWEQFPPLYWRYPIDGIKKGANVVSYAAAIEDNDEEAVTVSQTLRMQKEQREKDALIVVQKKGHGRIAMINLDRTWRLRYGYGDRYHHQFWKQLINWGIGDKLRSGNDYIRLGTPDLTYTNNDKVTVMVKIQDNDFKPVHDGTFHLTIYSGDKKIRRRQLRYKEGSAGLYEVTFDRFTDAGRYTAQLDNVQLNELGVVKSGEKVSTEFLIVSAKAPIEISELAARDDILKRISDLTRGKKASVLGAKNFIQKFGEGNKFIEINKDTPLWDSFAILILLLSLVSAEWIVRKLGGLV